MLTHNSKLKTGGRIVIATALVSLGVAGGLSWNRVNAAERESASERAARAVLMDKTNILAEMETGFSAIADRAEPAVVSIDVQKRVQMSSAGPERMFQFFGGDDEPNAGRRGLRQFSLPDNMPEMKARGAGSGAIVRSDGWIITNDHVVGGADKVTVTLHDGRKFPGTVRRDVRSDLAVVKINANNLPTLEFADSDKVKVGQWAIAFGSPFELNDTMTVGIVSAQHRQKAIAEMGQQRFYPSLLQTDASINPGNSGGPLLDSRGRLIGINVAINSPSGGSVGIGFAIPSNTAKNVMDQLVSTGKVTRGFLGLLPEALNPEQRKQFGVAEGGALVRSVSVDTPAAKAGIQAGDVIIKFNGQSVSDDIRFRDLVSRTSPGTSVEVTVIRDHKEHRLRATLSTIPETSAPAESVPAKAERTGSRLGVMVAPIDSEEAKQFKVDKSAKGAVVLEVVPGSAAADAGIQPGDVLNKLNGRIVTKPEDVKSAVQSVKSGDKLNAVIQRGKSIVLIDVVIP